MSGFDIVVVGAGSAGAVLAARLAGPDRSVLLIDAGPGVAGARSTGAIAAADFFPAASVDDRAWTGTRARLSHGSEPVRYLHGRGLGGSSAINGLVADLGIPEDYDEWERRGATGWGWSDLAPWFGRTALSLRPAGDGEVGPLGSALLASLPAQASRLLLTRDAEGLRVTTADAYLRAGLPGLAVRSGTTVVRLLVDGRTAVGVEIGDGSPGRPVEAIIAGEVIVAAGAVESPLLLLRSGIDTPGIGDGLRDHPGFGIVLRPIAGAPAGDPRTGGGAGAHGLAIAVGARLSSGEEPADLQLLALEHLGDDAPGLAMLLVGLMRTSSTGSVRTEAGGAGLDLRMLGDEGDVRRLQSGVDQAYALLHTARFSGWIAETPHPTSADHLRAGLGGYYHAAGTCAMGTVVDSDCRVRGYRGVRVCDASIMPSLPRAGPHLTTVAMAEHLAAMMTTTRPQPS